jgi:hypothetical protein
MELIAYNALRAAQIHAHLGQMSSSAQLCAKDAEALFNRGEYAYAHKRALKSLAYSVGKFSPVYRTHNVEMGS